MIQGPWQEQALCQEVDPEIFFPEHGGPLLNREAKKVCSLCVVREKCLDAAKFETYGTWGGMTERERRKAKKLQGA